MISAHQDGRGVRGSEGPPVAEVQTNRKISLYVLFGVKVLVDYQEPMHSLQ